MRRHTPIILNAVRTDRRKGMSIFDLMQKYSLPKTTVWNAVQDVKLFDKQKIVLRSRMGAGAKRSQKDWDHARGEAENILAPVKKTYIWPVLLAALYWSEGTKKNGFIFTNTDKIMIQVFLKILRENLSIKDSDLNILIRTSSPMDPMQCRRYWSDVAKVPMSQIKINHDDKQNKSKTQYGICRITLRKGGHSLKLVHCLIQGLTAKIL